jgi:hypothetical protein
MTPKEKAKSIIDSYAILITYDFINTKEFKNPFDTDLHRRIQKDAKKCALKAIELVIEQNEIWIMQTGTGNNNYLNEVKKEIKNTNFLKP